MADEKKPEQSKIVVDEDWKAQAEAEKQRLAEQEEHPEKGGEAGPRELPPANFATLISGIVTQALFSLGAIPDPQTGRRYLDLALAKHHIDTLSMLDEKTKGNLADEEKQMLDQALYEVRMLYVRMAQGGIGS